MSWSVTLAGETFTDASVAGTAYADEATGFPAILAAFAREAAFLQGLAATSATFVIPAVGPVVLATHQDAATVGLSAGMLVRAASAADPGRLMIGTVTAFAGTTLGLQVIFAAGAGAADWVIGRPAGGTSLALDPAPALTADLDAAGRSIVGLLGLAVTGGLTVDGPASFAAAGQSRIGYLGDVSGTVLLRASDPTSMVCTVVGDTTFLVAGAITPGHEHAHRIRATIGGAGGWSVTTLPASLLTRSNDLADTGIDSGWQQVNVASARDITTPAGDGWTVSATGTGLHYFQARRIYSAAPYDYVGTVLLKAAGTSRVRLWVRLDTLGHGGYVDVDLESGMFGIAGTNISGTILGSGIAPVGDGWFAVWLAVDVLTAGYSIILQVTVQDTGGAESFAAAGESVLFGGATLCAAASHQGFQHVGASRPGSVLWQGVPVDWPSKLAGTTVDLMIQSDPDRIIQQDYTPEEI